MHNYTQYILKGDFMENIKKLKPTTELWIKIKWMANYAKPAIPF